MDHIISRQEHYKGPIFGITLPVENPILKIPFPKKSKFSNQEYNCIHIYKNGNEHELELSYFIGVDWIIENEKVIYVEPKLNEISKRSNYLEMLFSALKHPEVAKHAAELYEIKFDKKYIEIVQEQDLLTPLLVVHFLRITKEIVKKGLKKSYYKTTSNLHAKVKGKVVVGETIKQNLVKNKSLSTFCSYDEFGLNSLENRLIKKALLFVKRYLPAIKNIKNESYITDIFNYILPAFEDVSPEVNLHDIKYSKTNVFYKEYAEALRLAKLILKRFGYNINTTEEGKIIKTPPFWIDMSKMFELYALGFLKDMYSDKVLYGKNEAKANYGLPDYLLIKENEKMIIDAKYRPLYQNGEYDIADIRQISGYARDMKVLNKLLVEQDQMIECLIIYPESLNRRNINDEIKLDLSRREVIEQFAKFYKVALKLPLL